MMKNKILLLGFFILFWNGEKLLGQCNNCNGTDLTSPILIAKDNINEFEFFPSFSTGTGSVILVSSLCNLSNVTFYASDNCDPAPLAEEISNSGTSIFVVVSDCSGNIDTIEIAAVGSLQLPDFSVPHIPNPVNNSTYFVTCSQYEDIVDAVDNNPVFQDCCNNGSSGTGVGVRQRVSNFNNNNVFTLIGNFSNSSSTSDYCFVEEISWDFNQNNFNSNSTCEPGPTFRVAVGEPINPTLTLNGVDYQPDDIIIVNNIFSASDLGMLEMNTQVNGGCDPSFNYISNTTFLPGSFNSSDPCQNSPSKYSVSIFSDCGDSEFGTEFEFDFFLKYVPEPLIEVELLIEQPGINIPFVFNSQDNQNDLVILSCTEGGANAIDGQYFIDRTTVNSCVSSLNITIDGEIIFNPDIFGEPKCPSSPAKVTWEIELVDGTEEEFSLFIELEDRKPIRSSNPYSSTSGNLFNILGVPNPSNLSSGDTFAINCNQYKLIPGDLSLDFINNSSCDGSLGTAVGVRKRINNLTPNNQSTFLSITNECFTENIRWEYTNSCGDFIDFEVNFQVINDIPIDFSYVPPDLTLDAIPTFLPQPILEGCVDDTTPAPTNITTTYNANSIVIERNWEVADLCGNTVSDSQTTTINMPPCSLGPINELPWLNNIITDLADDCNDCESVVYQVLYQGVEAFLVVNSDAEPNCPTDGIGDIYNCDGTIIVQNINTILSNTITNLNTLWDCSTNTTELDLSCPNNIEVTANIGSNGATITWQNPTTTTTCTSSTGTNNCTQEVNGFSFLGEYQGHHYFLSDDGTHWVDAQANAEANGGYLVSINDDAENQFLQSVVGDNIVHIGLYDQNDEGNFEWASGEPLTYTNWRSGQPDNQQGSTFDEDFVTMDFWSGEWRDVSFWVNKRYVMELPCSGGGTGGTTIAQTSGLSSGSFFPVGTSTITYQATDGCGNEKTCSFNVKVNPNITTGCDNITDGGMIGNDEENCGSFDPAPVVNLVSPSGGSGNIEYRWIFSGLDCPYTNGTVAPNANGPEADPGYIGSSLYLIRQARREGCQNWINSNCVTKEVKVCNNNSTTNTLIHLQSEILSLWVKNENGQPKLDWVNNTQHKNLKFVIERSMDGQNFEAVKDVESLHENSLEPRTYSTVDSEASPAKNYYRVKALFENGEYIYSEIRDVDLFEFSIIPNPAEDEAFIDLSSWEGKSAEIFIYNNFSHLVHRQVVGEVGQEAIRIDLSDLVNGVYIVYVKAGNFNRAEKLVITKDY